MIEVIACDTDGRALSELGRRFQDSATPEIFIDGMPYVFVRFREPRVAVYHRRGSLTWSPVESRLVPNRVASIERRV
jgi:hypothetical protein